MVENVDQDIQEKLPKDEVLEPRCERWEGKSRKDLGIKPDRSTPRCPKVDPQPTSACQRVVLTH